MPGQLDRRLAKQNLSFMKLYSFNLFHNELPQIISMRQTHNSTSLSLINSRYIPSKAYFDETNRFYVANQSLVQQYSESEVLSILLNMENLSF